MTGDEPLHPNKLGWGTRSLEAHTEHFEYGCVMLYPERFQDDGHKKNVTLNSFNSTPHYKLVITHSKGDYPGCPSVLPAAHSRHIW